MCGIVGMVIKGNTGLFKQTEDLFYQMLFADTLRGEDSTGIIGVEHTGTFHVMKEACEATMFIPKMQEDAIGKAMFRAGKAFIGHNRKKTVGATSDANAHPFVTKESFAMVHNGTLTTHKHLADTEVDSEALTIVVGEALSKKDYIPALEGVLEKVNGAYALAAYNQDTHSVHLLRNKERPLFLVETNNAWLFASEGIMLQWLMARNGYLSNDLQKVSMVPEHTLITFDLTKTTMKSEEISVKKPIPSTGMATGTGDKTTSKPTFTWPLVGLSKNEYKRARKRLIGTTQEFWSEDFVEANYPKTFEDDGETVFTLMGVSDKVLEDHIIFAQVDIAPLKLTPNDLTERLWKGLITDISYDSRTRQMILQIGDTKPVIGFKPKLDIVDADYIRSKLDEQEKTLSTVH